MLDNISSFTLLATVLPIVLFLVGVLLFYGIVRAAVVGALRDHQKWMERRSGRAFLPKSSPSDDVLGDAPRDRRV